MPPKGETNMSSRGRKPRTNPKGSAARQNSGSEISEYMKKIGRNGGLKSRRTMTKEQASATAKARWAKQRGEIVKAGFAAQP